MIVLDASVLIAHLDGRDAHHRRARHLLEESGGDPLGASSITLAETLVSPARSDRLREARTALERLGVVELGFRNDAAAHLARLRARTGLKMPDCCVLLAAQQHDGRIATFDTSLNAAAATLEIPLLHPN